MSKVMTYQAGRNHFVMIARDHRDKNVEQTPKMYYYTSEKSALRKFERVCQSIRPRCGFSTYIAMGVLTNPNPVREHTIEMLPLPPEGQKMLRERRSVEGVALLAVYKEENGKKKVNRYVYTKVGIFIEHSEEEQVSVLYTFNRFKTYQPFDKVSQHIKDKMVRREIAFEEKDIDATLAVLRAKHFFAVR
ncbi:MAG: hypothetical protein Q4A15_11570, partial [Prevotellaceae bacterium]|nr:hypothetical protein [Prevotellaceae bacterium]